MSKCLKCEKETAGKFCSYACKNLFYFSKEKIKKICPVCKNNFFVVESKKDKIFCSRKCFSESSKEERVCIICNKTFIISKKNVRKTCSSKCSKIFQQSDEVKIKRAKSALETNLQKYGKICTLEVKEFRDKSKKTKLLKYNDENYVNYIKAQETCLKKYGVKSFNPIEAKKTKKLKYNDENWNNRKKFKKTIKERYGVDHHLKLEEFIKKQKETFKNKYGVESVFNFEGNLEKAKNAQFKKYGNWYCLSGEYKLKLQQKRDWFIRDVKKYLSQLDLELLEEKYIGKFDKDKKYIKYNLKCLKCNNKFFYTQLGNGGVPICRNCFPISSNSSLEKIIENFLISNNIKYKKNDRSFIYPLELDFLIDDYKLAIEVNGNYFHSDANNKDKNYHLNKSKLAYEKGYKLIHIFEDELLRNQEIVFSRLKNLLNINTDRIFARKCSVKELNINEKREFLNFNHLQKDVNDNVRYGLFYNNKLVSVMTFGKRRLSNLKKDEWELIRFCNLINTSVIGAFSRLLKYFINAYKPKKIITFADIRWSGLEYKNTIYSKNKFNFLYETGPNYFYIYKKGLERIGRFNFRKSMLNKKLELFNEELTEYENMKLNGYNRIYDCGSLKFELVV